MIETRDLTKMYGELYALNRLTLITSAHQYIAKPFDALKLRDLIQRSFTAQERIINQGLRGVSTSIRSIPSLPLLVQPGSHPAGRMANIARRSRKGHSPSRPSGCHPHPF